MAEKPVATDSNAKPTWLQRQWQGLRDFHWRDVIIGKVDQSSGPTAIGKYIVQIGMLSIPLWLALIIAGMLTGLFVLVAWMNLSPLLPRAMPDSSFNIAIAKFNVIDENHNLINNLAIKRQANQRIEEIAHYLRIQSTPLSDIGLPIEIWGPDIQRMAQVKTEAEAAQIAEKLHAVVLLYGDIQALPSGDWQLWPKFFIVDSSIESVRELVGPHALGNIILDRTNNVFAPAELNITLHGRLEAFIYILKAIGHLSQEPSEYTKSRQALEWLLKNSGWIQAKQSGQEILYHFLGTAFLGEALSTADIDQKTRLLLKSQDAYAQAIALNSNYVRAYNGLGSVYYYKALQADLNGCNTEAQSFLVQATNTYTQVLQIVPKLPSDDQLLDGPRRETAIYHLAMVDLLRGYCATKAKDVIGAMQLHQAAAQNYRRALSAFEQNPQPTPLHFKIAIQSYAGLSRIAVNRACNLPISTDVTTYQANLNEAIMQYQKAFELVYDTMNRSTIPDGLEIMPEYLATLCGAQQGSRAVEVLDQFVNSIADYNGMGEAIIRQEITEQVGLCHVQWKECSDAAKTIVP